MGAEKKDILPSPRIEGGISGIENAEAGFEGKGRINQGRRKDAPGRENSIAEMGRY